MDPNFTVISSKFDGLTSLSKRLQEIMEEPMPIEEITIVQPEIEPEPFEHAEIPSNFSDILESEFETDPLAEIDFTSTISFPVQNEHETFPPTEFITTFDDILMPDFEMALQPDFMTSNSPNPTLEFEMICLDQPEFTSSIIPVETPLSTQAELPTEVIPYVESQNEPDPLGDDGLTTATFTILDVVPESTEDTTTDSMSEVPPENVGDTTTDTTLEELPENAGNTTTSKMLKEPLESAGDSTNDKILEVPADNVGKVPLEYAEYTSTDKVLEVPLEHAGDTTTDLKLEVPPESAENTTTGSMLEVPQKKAEDTTTGSSLDLKLQEMLDSLAAGSNLDIPNDESLDLKLQEILHLFPCDPDNPIDPTDYEAQIDARLQAELNSLPMVEPEPDLDPKPTIIQPQVPVRFYNQEAAKPRTVQDPPKPLVQNTPQQPSSSNNLMQLKMPNQIRMMPKNPQERGKLPPGRANGIIPPSQMNLAGFPKSLTDFIKAQSGSNLGTNVYQSFIRTQMAQRKMQPQQLPAPLEDDEVDFEEIGVADTFSSYWPSKLKGGSRHPDSVVETATLSSVELPDITYELALPEKLTNSECLSALQLEAVTYACQAHEQLLPSGERAGFLLGDGAGVGKGRTIAAIIYENFLRGRKRALWISVSNDLKFDAERDLGDIGASKHIKVASMSKFKYCRITSAENGHFKKGVIFCTYTALIGESANAEPKYNTRLRQLINWFSTDYDGVIVLDECHKAKNLSLMNAGKSTKTGTTVLELQQLLPMARVVYASATGASEPKNMAYMVRLGLWGPGTSYSEFFKFVNTVEKRGIGAMEIVAMDMKLRGSYIARQLSFKDVTFRIEEVPMSREFHKLYNHSAELWAEINEKFIKAFRLMCIENRVQKIIICQFWSAHQRFFKNLCIASKVPHVVKMVREAAKQGKAVVIGLQSTGESRTLEHLELYQGELSGFVSTSKMIIKSFVEKYFPAPTRESFYKLLYTGTFEPESRHRTTTKRPRLSELSDGDSDSDGGDSDMDMAFNNWNNDDDDDERFKSGRKRRGRPPRTDKSEKVTMQDRILEHLCINMNSKNMNDEYHFNFDIRESHPAKITEQDVERCITVRERLLDKIEHLGRRMPPNTLDKIISKLGTNVVAEMTGRRGRIIKTDDNRYRYEQRGEAETSMDLVNYMEKQRFMEDTKHVAIISEAASSGISLQSDRRLARQRRRLHITLELPWSADRAIQQFGRTHRSNQANAPEYVFLISDLGGESRFAATVAKRLESLGALTQGDRRATDARDLSKFNIDNNIGRCALENVLQQITGEKPLERVHIPESYKGDFSFDCCVALSGVGMLSVTTNNKGQQVFIIEKDSYNIPKFLNRILGCRVEVQNALFKFFLNKMYSLILQMKRTGHFDLGILDLDAHGANVTAIKLIRFIRKHATGTAATELHTMQVVRGMSFDQALAKFNKEERQEHEGFYMFKQERNNNNCAILCLNVHSEGEATTDPTKLSLKIYRPNTGPQVRTETLSSIGNRYVKASADAVKQFWVMQYNQCLKMCSHIYWNRRCPYGSKCVVGLRLRTYHVLSGLMLPIWDRIAFIIEKDGRKIQMIRVKTDENKKIVGTMVPEAVYQQLVADLSSDSKVESTDLTKKNQE